MKPRCANSRDAGDEAKLVQLDRLVTQRGMAAGPVFDVGGEAHVVGEIAHVEELVGFRQAERGVVQPRPGAGREHDVVRIAAAPLVPRSSFWQ
jgi:hypothetical protein